MLSFKPVGSGAAVVATTASPVMLAAPDKAGSAVVVSHAARSLATTIVAAVGASEPSSSATSNCGLLEEFTCNSLVFGSSGNICRAADCCSLLPVPAGAVAVAATMPTSTMGSRRAPFANGSPSLRYRSYPRTMAVCAALMVSRGGSAYGALHSPSDHDG